MFQVNVGLKTLWKIGKNFIKNIAKLFAEFSSIRKALKADRQALIKLDPSFEAWYQFWFHAGYRALRLYRMSRAFYISNFKFLAYLLYHINRVFYSVDIHPGANISPGVVIDHGTGVVIGSTAEVGSGTIIYHGVTLGARYVMKGKRHPTIGQNVVLGAGAKVIGPVYIGNNVKVGANAVVNRDVPDNATVVGIPARIVKFSNLEMTKSDGKDDALCRCEPLTKVETINI
ncbi:MAG: serine O-acetyltransferase EpsC [Fervidobacterium sp.]|jgi:serine O-acetyltransferase